MDESKMGNQVAFDLFNRGARHYSNICMWCGDNENNTESHLFSESIGGRFVTDTSCKPCNEYLGHAVESNLLKNGLIAAARFKLGIATRKEAYRHADKIDAVTGRKIRFDDKKGVVFTTSFVNGKEIGSSDKDKVAYLSKHMEAADPKKLEQLLEGKNTDLSVPSGKVLIKMQETLDRSCVFKIIYEFSVINGLFSVREVRESLLSMVQVFAKSNKRKMEFSDELSFRVFDNVLTLSKQSEYKEQIPFKNLHYIVLRSTPKKILYFEIGFFGEIRSILIVDKIEEFDKMIVEQLNIQRIFEINNSTAFYRDLNNKPQMEYVLRDYEFVEQQFLNLRDHEKKDR